MKILYIGYELVGDNSATGNTLYNLFNDSNINVLQACTDYSLRKHSKFAPTVTLSKYKSFLFYVLKKLYRKCSEKDGQTQVSVTKKVSGHKKGSIISLFQAILDVLPKKFSDNANITIDLFKPEVIYTLGENISTLKLCVLYSLRYNIPIVIHTMDDIESNIYSESVYLSYFRKKYLRLLQGIYQNYKYHLAISPLMAKDFSLRHNVNYDFAMNCVDDIGVIREKSPNLTKLVFSGGLHGGRAETLLSIDNLLLNNNDLQEKVTLNIYTSKSNVKYYKHLFKFAKLLEFVPQDKVRENLSHADILLHVESFETSDINYFRYSLSTKIPEYLSIGRPIICYGPIEINTVSYLKENNAGVIASNDKGFVEGLRSLIKDKDTYRFYSQKALEIAACDHTKGAVQKKVYDILTNAIKYYHGRKLEKKN